MAYIEWEDDTGTHTLTPSYPAGPARRFRSWTPDVEPVGPFKYRLGTGVREQFQFRRDHKAKVVMPGIRPDQFEDYLLFRIHALSGCNFFVATEDAASNVYECVLAEGSVPTLEMSDAQMLEYTIELVAKNTAAAPMLCDYRTL